MRKTVSLMLVLLLVLGLVLTGCGKKETPVETPVNVNPPTEVEQEGIEEVVANIITINIPGHIFGDLSNFDVDTYLSENSFLTSAEISEDGESLVVTFNETDYELILNQKLSAIELLLPEKLIIDANIQVEPAKEEVTTDEVVITEEPKQSENISVTEVVEPVEEIIQTNEIYETEIVSVDVVDYSFVKTYDSDVFLKQFDLFVDYNEFVSLEKIDFTVLANAIMEYQAYASEEQSASFEVGVDINILDIMTYDVLTTITFPMELTEEVEEIVEEVVETEITDEVVVDEGTGE